MRHPAIRIPTSAPAAPGHTFPNIRTRFIRNEKPFINMRYRPKPVPAYLC